MLRQQMTLLLTLAAISPCAMAQKVGQPAPEITYLSTYHFDGIKNEKLSQLRGSTVLLEFFVMGIGQIDDRVEKLNALHERYFDRGLVVIGVTFGEPKDLEAWFEKQKVTFPVAVASFTGYDPKVVPFGVLVAPDGKVLWAGEPTSSLEARIEPALAGARPANLAAGLEEVGKLATEGKCGESYLKAKELLAAGTLSDEAKTQAEHRIAAAEATVQKGIEQADKAAGDGDFHKAWVELDPIVQGYTGVPRADEAAQKLEAMLADKKQKREIDAGKVLTEVEELQRQREYDEAYKAFKKLATQWSNTRAAKVATAAALAIQKGGKLGFDRGCGACQAADKTCSLHAKKRR